MSQEDIEQIKYLSRKNPSLSKQFVSLYEQKKATVPLIELFYRRYTQYKQLLKAKNFNLSNFSTIEKAEDHMHNLIKENEKKKYINSFLSNKYKHLLDESNTNLFGELQEKELDRKIIENGLNKIASFKTPNDLNKALSNILNSVNNNSLEKMRKKIEETNGARVVFENKIQEVLIAEIEFYPASQKLGSSSWCISYSSNYFNSYVRPHDGLNKNRQLFIYDFKAENNNKSLIGATLTKSFGRRNAHFKNDSVCNELYLKNLFNRIGFDPKVYMNAFDFALNNKSKLNLPDTLKSISTLLKSSPDSGKDLFKVFIVDDSAYEQTTQIDSITEKLETMYQNQIDKVKNKSLKIDKILNNELIKAAEINPDYPNQYLSSNLENYVCYKLACKILIKNPYISSAVENKYVEFLNNLLEGYQNNSTKEKHTILNLLNIEQKKLPSNIYNKLTKINTIFENDKNNKNISFFNRGYPILKDAKYLEENFINIKSTNMESLLLRTTEKMPDPVLQDYFKLYFLKNESKVLNAIQKNSLILDKQKRIDFENEHGIQIKKSIKLKSKELNEIYAKIIFNSPKKEDKSGIYLSEIFPENTNSFLTNSLFVSIKNKIILKRGKNSHIESLIDYKNEIEKIEDSGLINFQKADNKSMKYMLSKAEDFTSKITLNNQRLDGKNRLFVLLSFFNITLKEGSLKNRINQYYEDSFGLNPQQSARNLLRSEQTPLANLDKRNAYNQNSLFLMLNQDKINTIGSKFNIENLYDQLNSNITFINKFTLKFLHSHIKSQKTYKPEPIDRYIEIGNFINNSDDNKKETIIDNNKNVISEITKKIIEESNKFLPIKNLSQEVDNKIKKHLNKAKNEAKAIEQAEKIKELNKSISKKIGDENISSYAIQLIKDNNVNDQGIKIINQTLDKTEGISKKLIKDISENTYSSEYIMNEFININLNSTEELMKNRSVLMKLQKEMKEKQEMKNKSKKTMTTPHN